VCLLIVLTGVDEGYPIIAAGNRDEDRARRSAPPGLFVGARHRMLSPRDRLAGGTWLAVNDRGLFAGLTNLVPAAVPDRADAPSRGLLPHLALDEDDLAGAVEAVARAVADAPPNAFQLVLSDGRSSAVLGFDGAHLERHVPAGPVVVVSNEHRLGALPIPGIAAILDPRLDVEVRLGLLADVLLDTGERSGHRILKRGGSRGTVSSSLIAVPTGEARRLIWRYAPGPPDAAAYADYGNLARRLTP
jgi:hypothetical protein